VKRKSVVRSAAPLFALLLLGAFVPLAHADVQIVGYLSTGSHIVNGDSVAVMDMGGGFRNYVTTGWGGDTMTVDSTVMEPPMGAQPIMITLFYRQDDSTDKFDVNAPVSDSWYTIPGTPTEAQVKFVFTNVGVAEPGRPGQVRTALTVSPSIVQTGATIRAERVAGPNCTFTLYDVAGNRVRTLRTQTTASGTASATWNGSDDLGRRLPEGIYYCCLDDAASPTVRKLVLSR
jgi:hypothetical protein